MWSTLEHKYLPLASIVHCYIQGRGAFVAEEIRRSAQRLRIQGFDPMVCFSMARIKLRLSSFAIIKNVRINEKTGLIRILVARAIQWSAASVGSAFTIPVNRQDQLYSSDLPVIDR